MPKFYLNKVKTNITILNLLFKADVEHFDGHARFDENGICHIGDMQLKGEHTLIATGGKPLVPNIPGVYSCI